MLTNQTSNSLFGQLVHELQLGTSEATNLADTKQSESIGTFANCTKASQMELNQFIGL